MYEISRKHFNGNKRQFKSIVVSLATFPAAWSVEVSERNEQRSLSRYFWDRIESSPHRDTQATSLPTQGTLCLDREWFSNLLSHKPESHHKRNFQSLDSSNHFLLSLVTSLLSLPAGLALSCCWPGCSDTRGLESLKGGVGGSEGSQGLRVAGNEWEALRTATPWLSLA